MKTTLGGDRLGSGNAQEIQMKNYERSTHDLSYTWRSTMAAGTLVPFMSRLALPGDNWDIKLNCEVLTQPTTGPLFGSYKVQLDVFEVPMRLYNAQLHMNKLGIGMDMSKVYLPQIEVLAKNNGTGTQTFYDNEHINAACLLRYLGITGLGTITGTTDPAKRWFNAVSYLSFWEIYKNYYSNKQETNAWCIHTETATAGESMVPKSAVLFTNNGQSKGNCLSVTKTLNTGDYVLITYPNNASEPDPRGVTVTVAGANVYASDVFTTFRWQEGTHQLTCFDAKSTEDAKTFAVERVESQMRYPSTAIGLKAFPLENIDSMRMQILQFPSNSAFQITSASLEPYCYPMKSVGSGSTQRYSAYFSQEALPLKTYQSDLLNNWINTEWIDGANGISAITAVSTVGDEFTIDALNIANKVYEMLNRIAISGGTYDDWLDAVYTHERVKGVDSPVYHGSLIKELAFEEVISKAETQIDDVKKPVGTLAGRGRLTDKHKGGHINISVHEPAYIIGIVSLTPRIEYSQGNEFDMNLKTYDDFHKPALDAIGYQDLIAEQALYTTTSVNSTTGATIFTSLGKQPAWINYMTSIDKCYGHFAEPGGMFMVLNRRYEKNTNGSLKDATTYIDPAKFNNIFAQTSIDSQNFWVQIRNNITARRKMSAKVIPNL